MGEFDNLPLPKIFFLDDDGNFLSSLQRSTHEMRKEWEMIFLKDPQEAIEKIRAEPAALLVSDWMMQGMDGLSVCRQLRTDEAENPELARYVILLTGRQAPVDQVVALDNGADDFILKPFDRQILLARIRVGLRLLAMQTRLHQANRRLNELATTDPLTGALNRRQGAVVINAELERVRRGQQDLSLILVDLDKFKQVNDTHGHAAGDAALCATVNTLKAGCRGYDSVVRWGGDEILIICPFADATQSAEIAERLRAAIAATAIEAENCAGFSITTSLGVATVPKGGGCDIEHLVALADAALYVVKSVGGNRFACAPWKAPAVQPDGTQARRNTKV